MELTKKEALESHRKMWTWIANEIKEEKYVVNIILLKKRYLGFSASHIVNYCFLCDYDDRFYGDCKHCPVDTNFDFYDCLGGLYEMCFNARTYEEQYELALEIANLPEREDA